MSPFTIDTMIPNHDSVRIKNDAYTDIDGITYFTSTLLHRNILSFVDGAEIYLNIHDLRRYSNTYPQGFNRYSKDEVQKLLYNECLTLHGTAEIEKESNEEYKTKRIILKISYFRE